MRVNRIVVVRIEHTKAKTGRAGRARQPFLIFGGSPSSLVAQYPSRPDESNQRAIVLLPWIWALLPQEPGKYNLPAMIRFTLLILLSGGAVADSLPCAAANLAGYIALGTSGCTIGQFAVSDFQYSGTAPITADQVAVSITGDQFNLALDFRGNWIVENGGSMAFDVAYTVTALGGEKAASQSFDVFGVAVPLETWSLRYLGAAGDSGTNTYYIPGTEIVAGVGEPPTLGNSGFGVTALTGSQLGSEFGITEFDERLSLSPVSTVPEPPNATSCPVMILMIATIAATKRDRTKGSCPWRR